MGVQPGGGMDGRVVGWWGGRMVGERGCGGTDGYTDGCTNGREDVSRDGCMGGWVEGVGGRTSPRLAAPVWG